MPTNYNSGTIRTIVHNTVIGSQILWMIAERIEDDLTIHIYRNKTGYDIIIVLRDKALEAAIRADPDAGFKEKSQKLLARYDQTSDTIETYPTTLAVGSPYFLQPKYNQIRTIKFEGYGSIDDGYGNMDLENLIMPSGFVRDMFAGFGVNYELNYIINAFKNLDNIETLVLSENTKSEIIGNTAHVTYNAFDTWRRAIKRSHKRAVLFANSAKRDYLRTTLPTEFGLTTPTTSKNLKLEELANSVLKALNLPGRQPPIAAAADMVKDIRKNLAVRNSHKHDLLALNREIELLTLEDIIKRIKDHISKSHNEIFWQKFLTDNPFIIRLAFGLPIAIFGEQVAVGGVKFDGSGGKIADYLLRAGAHGNMAIVEIKRPDTPLINSTQYRGGVYAPHKEISGAVTQVLDQRYQIQMEINNKKATSRRFDVFTYAMQGLVIAGSKIDDPDHEKSFELFRNGIKDVTIVTFSELLMKLEALHEFLMVDPSNARLAPVVNTNE